ncbi:hypothetical protein [Sediminitomix flava]|uniref:Uncharacterized protein n=1 Tax=Sediminitomix flava TaxID=379075 RepID=A0A315ZB89_SEDFL|nr:hypothetical protein [Sediminitomix flava]PWJ42562.1 hypothetical protein BC781_102105 [Sediminitomix flava]
MEANRKNNSYDPTFDMFIGSHLSMIGILFFSFAFIAETTDPFTVGSLSIVGGTLFFGATKLLHRTYQKVCGLERIEKERIKKYILNRFGNDSSISISESELLENYEGDACFFREVLDQLSRQGRLWVHKSKKNQRFYRAFQA